MIQIKAHSKARKCICFFLTLAIDSAGCASTAARLEFDYRTVGYDVSTPRRTGLVACTVLYANMPTVRTTLPAGTAEGSGGGGERLVFLFLAGAASGVRLRSSVTCGTCASSSAASRRACSTARGGAAAAAASKNAIVARRLRKGAAIAAFSGRPG